MIKLLKLGSILLATLLLQMPVKAQEQVSDKLSRSVTVQVDVKQSLMPNDAEQWVLYVYASKPGERLPLANFKGKLSQLPSEIILHQSMYLLPHLTLQQAENVVIVAKATKSKNPHQKSADDIIGYSVPVSFTSSPHQTISVSIDQHDKTVNK
ncbi:hypothetical protein FGD67_12120 [Colwellia sp. M166]|uniref:c-type cytochrome biogenesis protein CcmI/CycH n=1 Tax=Colwellia sp. M166 TaxID=2583805 RepID=UPI00211F11EC|nr:hypothetical protein [Colwellia sp. M166]UUO23889.1 hypothetical protein FGD67_12120 [Colwellia sp. M166]